MRALAIVTFATLIAGCEVSIKHCYDPDKAIAAMKACMGQAGDKSSIYVAECRLFAREVSSRPIHECYSEDTPND